MAGFRWPSPSSGSSPSRRSPRAAAPRHPTRQPPPRLRLLLSPAPGRRRSCPQPRRLPTTTVAPPPTVPVTEAPTTTAAPTTTTAPFPPVTTLPPGPRNIEPAAASTCVVGRRVEQRRRETGPHPAAAGRSQLLDRRRRRLLRPDDEAGRDGVPEVHRAGGHRQGRRIDRSIHAELHRARSTAAPTPETLVEVDKDRQLLFIVRDGKTLWTFNTSTGNGQPYRGAGQEQPRRVPGRRRDHAERAAGR